MKKGYIRLIVFEIFIMIVLLLNSFVFNMLSGYKMSLLLVLLLLYFFFRFGFEKDRHRYVKDIILETIIFLLIFLILYYLFGLLVGFSKTDNYYNFKGIKDFILPAILFVVLKEFLRYNIVCKAEGSVITIIFTVLTFILLDISQPIYTTRFSTNYDYLIFISFTLFPSISSNILLTYMAKKVGYKPALLYALVMRLYRYLLPIIPNPSPYIYSIIMLVVPIILMVIIYRFYKKSYDEEVEIKQKKGIIVNMLITSIPLIIMVYFVSGQFRFHAVAIASGSMTPNIYKGDIVIIDRKKIDFDNLKVGQVLAVKKGNLLIVHRLVKKVKIDDEYILYTKGDANEEIDNFKTKENEVYGIVNYAIPYIGLPTVWFNES